MSYGRVFEEPRFTDSNMIFSVWVEHGRPPLFDFMRDAICLLDADIFASSFWVECLPTAQESSEEPATSGSSQQPAEVRRLTDSVRTLECNWELCSSQ